MIPAMLRAAAAVALLAVLPVAQQPLPVTAAEASGFTRTSTLSDVRTFLDAVRALPRGDRLEVTSFGESAGGRDLLLVRVRRPDAPTAAGAEPLRVLVVANIHGGEVCGKEAVQILLREISAGEHDDVLAACDLWFVPIYNADGNDAIATTNRSNVNGPADGLGERENGQGLDLNRDCIKVRSPEFRALLGVMERVDPHLLFDLHTTNGSPHGYHLTYASSLSTNIDPDLDRYARTELLPAVRAAVAARHGFRIFDYGNFSRREPRVFATFDHRPRFLTNYHGLRNRLSLLSEAYAYEPFEVRVRATRAYVLEGLRALAADAPRVRELCAEADRRCVDGDDGVLFGTDTALADPVEMDVLVGVWDAAPSGERGARKMRRSEVRTVRMPVQNAFESRQRRPLPGAGWALIDAGDEVIDLLRAHGVEVRELGEALQGEVERFVPESGDKAARPPWGAKIRTIELRGSWRTEERRLAAGTVFVPARQRLARLAAQLLEPQSEDGLTTWGFFEERTTFAARGGAADGDDEEFPVFRLPARDGLVLR